MSPSPQDTRTEEQELLVCGNCGRVNPVAPVSGTRNMAVRCTGCGSLLRSERSRRVATECPSCQKHLEIEEDWVGMTVRCGACGANFEAQKLGGTNLPGEKAPANRLASRRVDWVPVAMPQPDPEVEAGFKGKFRRRRRKKRRIHQATMPWGLIAASVFTFGMVGGIIALVGEREGWWSFGHKDEPAAIAAAGSPGSSDPVLRSTELGPLTQVVKAFLSASSFPSQISLVRFQGAFEEKLASFKAVSSPTPMDVVSVEKLAESVIDGRLFLKVAGIDAGGHRKELVLERVAPGSFLVDWDSYIHYSTADWDSFTVRKSRDPETFQVFVRRDVVGHPGYPFDQFTSYQVFLRSIEDAYPLFVPKGSKEDVMLQKLTEPGARPLPIELSQPQAGTSLATLRIFFAQPGKEGLPPALELSRIEYPGWVNPAPGDMTGSSGSK